MVFNSFTNSKTSETIAMTIEINDNLLAIIDLLKALLHISLFSSAIFVFFSANCVFFLPLQGWLWHIVVEITYPALLSFVVVHTLNT